MLAAISLPDGFVQHNVQDRLNYIAVSKVVQDASNFQELTARGKVPFWMIIFPSNLSGCCNPVNEMWKNSLTSKRTTRTENSYVSKMSRVRGRPLRYATIPWAKSRNVLSCNLPNAIHVSCDNNSYDVLIKKCKEMHFYISLPSSASRIFMLMAKLS